MMQRLAKAARNLSRAPEIASCIRQSRDWPALIPAFLGARELRYPAYLTTRAGDRLKLETFHDLITAWIIFFRPEYEVLPSDRTIIDAGANIGAFSIYAARAANSARIIALEPFPETRARLAANVALNGLEARVAIRPWALGGSAGTKYMEDNASVPSQSRGALNGASGAYTVPIEAITLPALFEAEKIERASFVKMDIEGGEHEVFPAVTADIWRRIDRFALEYHPNGPKQELFATLRKHGFRLTKDLEAHPDSGVAHFQK